MDESTATSSWKMVDETDRAAVDDGPSAGARLRVAREARGLTVSEVAERLHLNGRHIDALENDDHTPFPAPIFVSGYLRNYARLLDIDAAPLIAAAMPREKPQPSLKAELSTSIPMHRRGLRPEILAGILVVTVLVGLALLWMTTRSEPAPTVSEVPAVQANEPSPPAPPEEEAGAFDAAGFRGMEVPIEEPLVAPPPPPEPTQQADELVLRFSGMSWIEISDATGRRLAVRMGEQGEELTLQGQAPFDILLGNAPNVQLEYNGNPYTDFRPTRQNVANFRVGRASE